MVERPAMGNVSFIYRYFSRRLMVYAGVALFASLRMQEDPRGGMFSKETQLFFESSRLGVETSTRGYWVMARRQYMSSAHDENQAVGLLKTSENTCHVHHLGLHLTFWIVFCPLVSLGLFLLPFGFILIHVRDATCHVPSLPMFSV